MRLVAYYGLRQFNLFEEFDFSVCSVSSVAKKFVILCG